MIEERRDDRANREHDKNSKRRENELDVEDLEQAAEDDCDGMAVQDGNEESIENVPRHLFGDRLDDASAAKSIVPQRHSTSFKLLSLIFRWVERKVFN